MSIKKTVSIMLVVGLLAVGVVGCGKDKEAVTDLPAPVGQTEKIVSTPEGISNAVEDELKRIKYDLPSIIDGARSLEDISKYVVGTIAPEVVIKPADDSKSASVKAENTEGVDSIKVTDAEAKAASEEAAKNTALIKPVENQDVLNFLTSTKTSKADYADFAVAFSLTDGYIVGIVKPTSGKEVAVEQAIRNFIVEQADTAKDEAIKAKYKAYKIEKHNGHIIIVVCGDPGKVASGAVDKMKAVDTLISTAVEGKFKLVNEATKANEVKESTDGAAKVTEPVAAGAPVGSAVGTQAPIQNTEGVKAK